MKKFPSWLVLLHPHPWLAAVVDASLISSSLTVRFEPLLVCERNRSAGVHVAQKTQITELERRK
jgi:hypothetical protein